VASELERLPHQQILLNLGTDYSVGFTHFERVIEIVSLDPAKQQAGRQRYRLYRAQGCALQHFDQTGVM
jgi:DNA polymerase-3 subunit chi